MFRISLKFLVFIVVICVSVAPHVFAAQSTADVSAKEALKDKARIEVLGDRAAAEARQAEYIIGHGDIVSVSVYGEGDMAASSFLPVVRPGEGEDAPRSAQSGVTVRMDGRISLKHIGDVEVVGMNLTQLADYLKKLYGTVFDDPIVTTTLVQSNSLRYTVMGNVTKPGIFYLDYPLTIVQTIARSGGFTEWASKGVTVVREKLQENDTRLFKGNTLEFDYDDFIDGDKLERNISIRSGDIIIVN